MRFGRCSLIRSMGYTLSPGCDKPEALKDVDVTLIGAATSMMAESRRRQK